MCPQFCSTGSCIQAEWPFNVVVISGPPWWQRPDINDSENFITGDAFAISHSSHKL